MKRLLILSGKGGTGKTTTAAAFLHFAGARAMADCDVDAPNLHLVAQQTAEPVRTRFIGSEKAVIDPERCVNCGQCRQYCRFDAIEKGQGCYRVNEFACEGCGVCTWVCQRHAVRMQEDVAGEQQLYLGDSVFSTARLKMGRGNSGKLVSAVKLAMLKNAPECDLAVIDGSPGIGCPVIASMSGMDLVLIVAEPSLSGVSDLTRLVETGRAFQTKFAVCVNKADINPEKTREIEAFCQTREIPFVGTVPYDPMASIAINAGRSVAEIDCPAADALKNIFKNTSQLLGL